MTQPKRVALCVTCLVDQILPEVGVATVQLLRRAGYLVDFPESQTCCGQPFFNSGFRGEAVDLAKRALQLAAKTYELSEFLVRYAKWKPDQVSNRLKLTYHDSCHMCRLLGVRNEPRQLLETAGASMSEMSESDRCCGFGGLFSVRMPEVSNAMTSEKLRQASECGADVLVTSDPGCLTQLRGLAARNSVKVEHLATVVEEMTR